MTVQGTKRDVLHTIADIQKALSVQQVEDTQIAEEIELNPQIIRNLLQDLAEEEYIKLNTFDTLAGTVYDVALTTKGKKFLEEDRVPT